MGKHHTYTYNGKEYTFKQLTALMAPRLRASGISVKTFGNRIRDRGIDIDKAADVPNGHHRTHVIGALRAGKQRPPHELSDEQVRDMCEWLTRPAPLLAIFAMTYGWEPK